MSGPQGPIEPAKHADHPIDQEVTIGHVHLRTADIDRVRDFYVGILGFDVVFEARDVPGWGTTGDMLFVSAGGYHHHIGFNTWLSRDGEPQTAGHTGLHHVALRFTSKEKLDEVIRRVVDADVSIRQITDHGMHIAVYFNDPDGNGLELMWDRPWDAWVDGDGRPVFKSRDMDVDEFFALTS